MWLAAVELTDAGVISPQSPAVAAAAGTDTGVPTTREGPGATEIGGGGACGKE